MATRPRPPWTVGALVALTFLAGAIDLALGAGLAAVGTGVVEAAQADTTTLGVGIGIGAIGLAQVAIGIGLFRRSTNARVILTVVESLRLIAAGYDAARQDGEPTATWLGTLVGASVMLTLAWVPATRRWFESEADRRVARAMAGLSRSRWRRTAELVTQAVVLALTVWWTPGVGTETWFAVPFAAAVVALVAWALQPLLATIAGRFGWLGTLATALFGYFVILGLALWWSPGITVTAPGWAFVASWVFAALMAAVTWAFSLGTDEYLFAHVARQALKDAPPPSDDTRGVIIVQLDGFPAPLLEAELRAGNLPTLSRWVRSGRHTWTEWTARVPSTTPVSQAGILHGSNEDIPAFRWWDRSLGRMLVANRPADAAIIEERVSDGRGLLADGGVSISNLFTGDAPTSFLTMSGVAGGAAALGSSRPYAAFFSHPAGFARALVMTLGEMVKELAQARSQERRGVEPRVARHGPYVALRGVTNVMLRDLNTALVVESMVRGAKSVYVDYVDYDEIAHHAGVTRPESLASLYGLDRVLGTLERVATSGIAAREYDFVVVSDHGQSQGATFAQRAGVSLEEFVAARTGGRTIGAGTDREGAGAPAALLVRELAAQGARSARAATRALERDGTDAGESGTGEEAIAVVGSGNLGGVWFTGVDHRMTLREIEEAHPGLVADLAAHPAIGFVVARHGRGAVAVGERGTHDLTTGAITGDDPLAHYPPQTAADFARVAAFGHAPDIYVNSVYDPVLDEVAAFEELVGCHGGVGGWQTRPVLMYPSQWALEPALLDDAGHLYGADTVHRQLVTWLEALGHRGTLLESRPRTGR